MCNEEITDAIAEKLRLFAAGEPNAKSFTDVCALFVELAADICDCLRRRRHAADLPHAFIDSGVAFAIGQCRRRSRVTHLRDQFTARFLVEEVSDDLKVEGGIIHRLHRLRRHDERETPA